ncbi:YbdD/YjiX family protein [Nocardiopsis tropica]|uniref:YbdD/YjiX family protein n=1 Tax=Tsukamurella strandjordii TaxID=147577 RepID=UPI0031CFAFBF
MGRTGSGQILRALKAVRWYVASVMGDNHYQRYLTHRRATHPGEPVMTEREYWKARHDGATVSARCC